MRVHVTGDLGFIGKHVRAHLEKLGLDVSGCDWPDDLRHAQELDVDAVVHLAALGGVGRAQRNPRSVMSTNVDATMALRAALRTTEACLPHVVQISSFSIYGGQPVPFHEGTEPRPREVYGASKLAQELCWSGYGGPLTTLRLSSVYGAAMRLDEAETTVIAKIAGAARDGEVFDVYEDGLQDRDFVHVGDVAACVFAALNSPVERRLVNVCSGERTSIIEACELLGAKHRVLNRPRSPGDMRSCWGLTDRVRELLGRAPVSFRERYRDIC